MNQPFLTEAQKVVLGLGLILCIFIMIFLPILLLSEKRDKEVMAIKYCFQERADGSLYHYVCEK